jgi:cytidylate kinase
MDPAHASGKGASAIPEVAIALAARDRVDSTRAASPLTVADDAIVIDTTSLSIEEAVERVMDVIARKG